MAEIAMSALPVLLQTASFLQLNMMPISGSTYRCLLLAIQMFVENSNLHSSNTAVLISWKQLLRSDASDLCLKQINRGRKAKEGRS